MYFWFKYDLNRSTMHPKVNPIGVRTHDLQIMDSSFCVPETLALTTEPSETSNSEI